MDKRRAEYIIAAVLVLVFVLILANSISKVIPKARRGNKTIVAMPAAGKTAALDFDKLSAPGQKAEDDDPGWGRDPFNPAGAADLAGDSIASLALMGITTGLNTKPRAVINDQLVTVGSRIGSFTILKIEKDKVLLTDGKEDFELLLKR